MQCLSASESFWRVSTLNPAKREKGKIVMAPERVAGDLYVDIDGQFLEIKRQLRQKTGYPHDPMHLVEHLQAAIDGNLVDRKGRSSPKPLYAREVLRDEGLSDRLFLVKDVGELPPDFVIEKLEVVSFLHSGKVHDFSKLMCKRALEFNANLGRRHAEYLLNHQEEIPVEWRAYHLVFPGTIWRDHPVRGYGNEGISVLRWDGKRRQWCLFILVLGGDAEWTSNFGLVRFVG